MSLQTSGTPPPLPPGHVGVTRHSTAGREQTNECLDTAVSRRQRSNSLGRRVAALAEACAGRVRRSLTPTPRQNGSHDEVSAEEQYHQNDTDCQTDSPPGTSPKRSASLGSRVAALAASGAGRLRRVVTPTNSAPQTRTGSPSCDYPVITVQPARVKTPEAWSDSTAEVLTMASTSSDKRVGPAGACPPRDGPCLHAETDASEIRGVAQTGQLAGELQQRDAVRKCLRPDSSGISMEADAPGESSGIPVSTTTVCLTRHQSIPKHGSRASQPQGGIEIPVDMGPRGRPPRSLHERLARKANNAHPSASISMDLKATSTPKLQTENQNVDTSNGLEDNGSTRGGLKFSVGFEPQVARKPPRLSRGGPQNLRRNSGNVAQDIPNLVGPREQDSSRASYSALQNSMRTSALLDFLSSPSPAEFLADHDILDPGDSIGALSTSILTAVDPALTAEIIRTLCGDLRKLDAAGLKTLLTWRIACNYQKNHGRAPTCEEVRIIYEGDVTKASRSRYSSEGTKTFENGPVVAASRQASIVQQAEAVRQSMTEAVQSLAGDDDKAVLDRLNQEIQELSEALRAQNLSSKDSYLIRKQLGQKRSEKARAERAVRKGRCAQKEISGGQDAVQAILESVSAAAPKLKAISEASSAIARQDPAEFESNEVCAGALTPRPPGFDSRNALPPEGSAARALAVLLHPDTLMGAGSAAIARVGMASRSFKDIALDGADLQFGDSAWRCVCRCFSRERALYSPEPAGPGMTTHKTSQQAYWRKLMLEHLWPSRNKWESVEASAPRKLGEFRTAGDAAHDFKIQVSVRFRPGETSKGKLLVPLHQKLTLLRKAGTDGISTICKKEPPEFQDALMGHLMADPVRLPSSGRICDRRVVEEQLRMRGNRDPFDGSPLTLEMLIPLGELRAQIHKWRVESRDRASNKGEEHKLEDDQVRELIGELGDNLDPELVEMLLEADRLRAAGSRAMRDAVGKQKRHGEDDDNEEYEDPEAVENQAEEEETYENAVGALRAMPAAGPRQLDGHGVEAEEEELGEAPKREGPKLLAVLPPTRVAMFQPGAGIRPFMFGRVFDGDAVQEDVYEHAARTSVCAVLNGFNACLLVYGQTGSGKTHTMFGQSVACGGNAGAVVSRTSGCVVRALREIFAAAGDLESQCGVVTKITAQYVQVYQDQVTCLCTGNAVSLREMAAGAPVVLQGAEETILHGLGDASQLLMNGEERKRYAETAMNHRSSRAHTVLVVKVGQQRGDLYVSSQLHLVDLAGSERVKKSRAQGGRLVEAVGINSSLMVLGMCIAARVEDRSHVPYYESKLTLLLRSALGGNSRTTAIICCHKEDAHGDETLQALSFGERCAMVSTRAHAAMAKSTAEAVAAIDAALAECGKRMDGLAARGKEHLPAFAKLQTQHQTLSRKRAELAGA